MRKFDAEGLSAPENLGVHSDLRDDFQDSERCFGNS